MPRDNTKRGDFIINMPPSLTAGRNKCCVELRAIEGTGQREIPPSFSRPMLASEMSDHSLNSSRTRTASSSAFEATAASEIASGPRVKPRRRGKAKTGGPEPGRDEASRGSKESSMKGSRSSPDHPGGRAATTRQNYCSSRRESAPKKPNFPFGLDFPPPDRGLSSAAVSLTLIQVPHFLGAGKIR